MTSVSPLMASASITMSDPNEALEIFITQVNRALLTEGNRKSDLGRCNPSHSELGVTGRASSISLALCSQALTCKSSLVEQRQAYTQRVFSHLTCRGATASQIRELRSKGIHSYCKMVPKGSNFNPKTPTNTSQKEIPVCGYLYGFCKTSVDKQNVEHLEKLTELTLWQGKMLLEMEKSARSYKTLNELKGFSNIAWRISPKDAALASTVTGVIKQIDQQTDDCEIVKHESANPPAELMAIEYQLDSSSETQASQQAAQTEQEALTEKEPLTEQTTTASTQASTSSCCLCCFSSGGRRNGDVAVQLEMAGMPSNEQTGAVAPTKPSTSAPPSNPTSQFEDEALIVSAASPASGENKETETTEKQTGTEARFGRWYMNLADNRPVCWAILTLGTLGTPLYIYLIESRFNRYRLARNDRSNQAGSEDNRPQNADSNV